MPLTAFRHWFRPAEARTPNACRAIRLARRFASLLIPRSLCASSLCSSQLRDRNLRERNLCERNSRASHLCSSSQRPSTKRQRSRKLPLAAIWVLAWWATLATLPPALANPASDDHAALRQFLASTIAESSSFEDRFDAEVWLVDMQGRLSRYVNDQAERLEFLKLLHHEAAQANLPPELVLAVIEVESHFDRFAVSKAGAQGYMQVMPFWREEIGRPGDNLTHPATNLRYGCRILQFYLNRENGNLHRALAAYNGSLPSRVYSDKVRRAWQAHWRTTSLHW